MARHKASDLLFLRQTEHFRGFFTHVHKTEEKEVISLLWPDQRIQILRFLDITVKQIILRFYTVVIQNKVKDKLSIKQRRT